MAYGLPGVRPLTACVARVAVHPCARFSVLDFAPFIAPSARVGVAIRERKFHRQRHEVIVRTHLHETVAQAIKDDLAIRRPTTRRLKAAGLPKLMIDRCT